MSWLRDLIFLILPWQKRPGEEQKAPPKKQPILKAKCPTCGYEADEKEFLGKDPWDTFCPICGEDETIYEL